MECQTLDDIFSTKQFKLAEISVCNWGSFHDKITTVEISEHGSLFTGDNGSGKTTIVDGHMTCLLTPRSAKFNAASSDSKSADRSLVSYVRGYYGNEEDDRGNEKPICKRPNAVLSGVRSFYRGDDGAIVTLIAIFYCNSASHAMRDIKRIYIAATTDVSLSDVFRAFGDNNPAGLKASFKARTDVSYCDESFIEYEAHFKRLLSMENDNAPKLLSRALGLKRVDDLTGMIRELVLEPFNLFDEAKELVQGVRELEQVKDEMEDRKKQRDKLAPLPPTYASYLSTKEDIAKVEAQQKRAPVYIKQQAVTYFTGEQDKMLTKQSQNTDAISLADKSLDQLKQDISALNVQYLEMGGDKIETTEKELTSLKKSANRVSEKSAQYQIHARALGLEEDITHSTFKANQVKAKKRAESLEEDASNKHDLLIKSAVEKEALEKEQAQTQDAISIAQQAPGSNIPSAYQRLRMMMCDELGIDKENAVFLGELIDIRPEESEWQGAIERVLGFSRLNLLVLPKDRVAVAGFLNSNHVGVSVLVRDVEVDDSRYDHKRRSHFLSDGFAQKLLWKESQFSNYAKHFVAERDLHCVDSATILSTTPRSMTKEGLIRRSENVMEKDDSRRVNDRNAWYIGFSNERLLALLKDKIREIESALSEVLSKIGMLNKDASEYRKLDKHLSAISETLWEDIDYPTVKLELDACEKLYNTLLETQLDAQKVKDEIALMNLQSKNESLARDELIEEKSKIKGELSSIEDALSLCQTSITLNAEQVASVADVIGQLSDDHLRNFQETIGKVNGRIQTSILRLQKKESELTGVMLRIMETFIDNEKWVSVTSEWQAEIACVEEFIEHYTSIVEEKLPDLLERFKLMLNKHSNDDVYSLDSKMQDARDDIEERIDVINDVLMNTEFQDNSYLQLRSVPLDLPSLKDFKRKVRVLKSTLGSDTDDVYKALSAVVNKLQEAIDNPRRDDNQSLLDPRYQMRFKATEINMTTQEIIDSLGSTGGKSGGEKERFAGIVLAASLSYVLCPDGLRKPVYSTVFLDEAFSNSTKDTARRVLSVFAELGLHVNLLTPLKNVEVTDDKEGNIHLFTRDPSAHESRVVEITWEKLAAKLKSAEEKSALEKIG